MTIRILVSFIMIAFLAACEVRTGESVVPQNLSTYRRCSDVERPQPVDVSPRLTGLLTQQDYPCVERLLRAAAFLAPDTTVVSTLVGLLMPSASASAPAPIVLPNTTKIVALHYLESKMQPTTERGILFEKYGDFIRAEAASGSSLVREDAFSLMFNIMQERDIPLIVAGIQSGSDSMVAVGTYALANSCSPGAIVALKEILHHPSVVAYLRKYPDKQDISKVVRRDCPAALT